MRHITQNVLKHTSVTVLNTQNVLENKRFYFEYQDKAGMHVITSISKCKKYNKNVGKVIL